MAIEEVNWGEYEAIINKRGRWRDQKTPKFGWRLVDIQERQVATCQMCGQRLIRYVHFMEHPDHPRLRVGCVCAALMAGEGNTSLTEDHEKLLRDRAARILHRASESKQDLKDNRFLRDDPWNESVELVECFLRIIERELDKITDRIEEEKKDNSNLPIHAELRDFLLEAQCRYKSLIKQWEEADRFAREQDPAGWLARQAEAKRAAYEKAVSDAKMVVARFRNANWTHTRSGNHRISAPEFPFEVVTFIAKATRPGYVRVSYTFDFKTWHRVSLEFAGLEAAKARCEKFLKQILIQRLPPKPEGGSKA